MHQSWPGMRRRRDSQPSIHLPRVVNLPGMKIAGSGLTRFALRREEVVVGGDRAATDSRRREIGEVGKLVYDRRHRSAHVLHLSPACSLRRPTVNRASGSCRVTRRGDRHELRDLTVAIRFEGRVRHILYGRRQQRRAADRYDEEHRLRAGRARRRRRAGGIRPRAWRGISSNAIRGSTRVTHRLDRARLGPDHGRQPRARPGVRRAGA